MVFPDVSERSLASLARLDGRALVITGAGQGLGFAVARRAVEGGAQVTLVDIDADRVARAATSLGGTARAIVADVRDSAAVDAAFAQAAREMGGVDGLVTSVGIFPSANALDMSDAQWHDVIDTDLTSTFWCARAFARLVEPERGGVIVNITSTEAARGRARLGHYTAAKFGAHGLTRTLAIELGPRNIRVLDVAPGLVRTESTEHFSRHDDPIETARQPAGRFAVPDDIARSVVFALSDLAAFVTGIALVVDGGELSG
jgi:NAD(P)-dependent dehydrogenase (short-subunit alcohol dehydrogenase family)